MATIVLRLVKGSALTLQEMDDNFTNINTELGQKLNTSTYTPTDILTKLKTVDGVGSGLDADLLDGMSSASTNTPSTIVARDSSGNFSANQITASFIGSLTGNVSGNATNVTGVVAVVNGGTGVTTSTGSGAVVLRNSPTLLGLPVIQDGTIAIGSQASGQPSIHIRYDGKMASATGGVAGAFGDFLTSVNYSTQIQSLISGSNGYRTPASNTPMITNGLNTFTSGSYSGLGRWGIFMESNKIGFGIPSSFSYNDVKIFRYNANSTIADEAILINSSNYNTYTPTLTGTGASGTWGINITGNASGNAGTASAPQSGSDLERRVARIFVAFTDSATILNSYGVSSVVKNSTGRYTITFTTQFADSNYTALAACENSSSGTNMAAGVESRLTTSVVVEVRGGGGGLQDTPYQSLVIYK